MAVESLVLIALGVIDLIALFVLGSRFCRVCTKKTWKALIPITLMMGVLVWIVLKLVPMWNATAIVSIDLSFLDIFDWFSNARFVALNGG